MKFARANKLDRKSGGTWGTRPLLLLVKPCYDTDSLGTEAGKFESRADSLPANRPAANETPCAPPGLLAQEEYSLKQDSPRGQGAVKEHHAGQKALLSRDRSFRAGQCCPKYLCSLPDRRNWRFRRRPGSSDHLSQGAIATSGHGLCRGAPSGPRPGEQSR